MNIKKILAFLIIFFMLTFRIEQKTYTNQKTFVKEDKIVFNDGVHAFMRTMSKIESNHSHTVVNQFGMMGKYQFNPKTVKSLGYDVSQQEFLQNPDLQDEVMLALMKNNKRALRNLIKKYHGKVVNDVLVTEAGILAGAHLVGPGGVLAFFYPGKYDFKTLDGNGVSVVYYMNKFKNYDVSGL